MVAGYASRISSGSMKRYWFQFDLKNYLDPPMAIGLGCGVTAFSKEEAISILQEKVFIDREIPPIVKCIENVDISTLYGNHVLPNMALPFKKVCGFR